MFHDLPGLYIVGASISGKAGGSYNGFIRAIFQDRVDQFRLGTGIVKGFADNGAVFARYAASDQYMD